MDVEKLAEMIDEAAWVARHLSGSAYPAGEPSALGHLLVTLERPGLFPEPATTFTASSPRSVCGSTIAYLSQRPAAIRSLDAPISDISQ